MSKEPTGREIRQGAEEWARETAETKQVEDTLRLNEARFDALLKLNQMAEAPLQDITDFALEAAVALTNSPIGYLAFVNREESLLQMHSWSKTALKQCRMAIKPRIYPVETSGLLGEAVRLRKPVITNDYTAPNPLKKGCPEGHVGLIRHMNIPVFDGSHIVAVAGVGNKATDYNSSDARQLQLLMQAMWHLVQRKSIDRELKSSEAKFRKLVETVGSAIFIFTPERIHFSNPAAQLITGHSRETLLSMSAFDLIHPDYHDLIIQMELSNRQAVDIHYRYGVKLLRKGGQEGWFDLAVSNMVYEGRKALLCIAHDVSVRKQLEENLQREKKRLQEMNITLRHVMQSVDQERETLAQAIAEKVKGLLLPALEKIETESDRDVAKAYIGIVRDQLVGLSSDKNSRLHAYMLKLTPTEMKICQFIQAGSSTKDIAHAMFLSVDTVQTHRKNIRKKLGLTGRRVNLFTFLKARESV